MLVLTMLWELIKYCVPMRRTEEMALVYNQLITTGYLSQDIDDYDFLAPVPELLPGEIPDATVLVRYVQWAEWVFNVRQLSPIYRWTSRVNL